MKMLWGLSICLLPTMIQLIKLTEFLVYRWTQTGKNTCFFPLLMIFCSLYLLPLTGFLLQLHRKREYSAILNSLSTAYGYQDTCVSAIPDSCGRFGSFPWQIEPTVCSMFQRSMLLVRETDLHQLSTVAHSGRVREAACRGGQQWGSWDLTSDLAESCVWFVSQECRQGSPKNTELCDTYSGKQLRKMTWLWLDYMRE